MGGVPTKHHSKSKVGRRRSHLALKPKNIRVCPNCKGPMLPHRACAQCGIYKKKERVK
ncbi:MAG: 50S ribosomal protein L32 [Patescibacteria group bacterium]